MGVWRPSLHKWIWCIFWVFLAGAVIHASALERRHTLLWLKQQAHALQPSSGWQSDAALTVDPVAASFALSHETVTSTGSSATSSASTSPTDPSPSLEATVKEREDSELREEGKQEETKEKEKKEDGKEEKTESNVSPDDLLNLCIEHRLWKSASKLEEIAELEKIPELKAAVEQLETFVTKHRHSAPAGFPDHTRFYYHTVTEVLVETKEEKKVSPITVDSKQRDVALRAVIREPDSTTTETKESLVHVEKASTGMPEPKKDHAFVRVKFDDYAKSDIKLAMKIKAEELLSNLQILQDSLPEEHARELVIDLFIKHELEELAHKLAAFSKDLSEGGKDLAELERSYRYLRARMTLLMAKAYRAIAFIREVERIDNWEHMTPEAFKTCVEPRGKGVGDHILNRGAIDPKTRVATDSSAALPTEDHKHVAFRRRKDDVRKLGAYAFKDRDEAIRCQLRPELKELSLLVRGALWHYEAWDKLTVDRVANCVLQPGSDPAPCHANKKYMVPDFNREYAGLSVDRSLTCLVWMKENNLKKEEAAELARRFWQLYVASHVDITAFHRAASEDRLKLTVHWFPVERTEMLRRVHTLPKLFRSMREPETIDELVAETLKIFGF